MTAVLQALQGCQLKSGEASSEASDSGSLISESSQSGPEAHPALAHPGKLHKEVLIGHELFVTGIFAQATRHRKIYCWFSAGQIMMRAFLCAAAYINHSCAPNCIMHRPFSGREPQAFHDTTIGTAVVKTLRDIQVSFSGS